MSNFVAEIFTWESTSKHNEYELYFKKKDLGNNRDDYDDPPSNACSRRIQQQQGRKQS